jgi:asparagine synthase (glutamine-hydrolysing)
MCGISGVVSLTGAATAERAERMCAVLAHRGPDSSGVVGDGGFALAARRLSIIDLVSGDQPVSNEDGTVHVVQNGEILNYTALRESLARDGHAFRSRGDTEVIAHLYERHGDGFAALLRGMFAIAVWDARRRRLVLARDRFGIKPLYYRVDGSELEFASELRALPRGEIDLDALEAYLSFNVVPGPRTIFRECRKLPPGHLLVWEDGGLRLEQFADPMPVPASAMRDGGTADLAAELRDRLRDSVRAHLVADVPVGVLLSGGVDSGLIAALAAEESARPLHTFTVGFDERSFDESEDAQRVAARYGTEHHAIRLRPDGATLLTLLADVFDEPFADSSALPTFLIAELAASTVKVVLSGEGGDELFGGYYTYQADLLAERTAVLARIARPAVELLPSSSAKASFDYRAKRFVRGARFPALERHHAWKEVFSRDARAALTGRVHDFDPVDILRERHSRTADAEPLARLQDVDRTVQLVDDLLVKTDRASMAWSLEARVPFLDTAVTELALALPRRMRVRLLRKKVLLRKAAAPLLPAEIVRGRKRGFSIPAAAWLRGDLAGFAREVLSHETLRRQGFFSPEAVDRLLEDHVAGREDLSRQIWCLLSFTLWHEHHVERTPTAVSFGSASVGALA